MGVFGADNFDDSVLCDVGGGAADDDEAVVGGFDPLGFDEDSESLAEAGLDGADTWFVLCTLEGGIQGESFFGDCRSFGSDPARLRIRDRDLESGVGCCACCSCLALLFCNMASSLFRYSGFSAATSSSWSVSFFLRENILETTLFDPDGFGELLFDDVFFNSKKLPSCLVGFLGKLSLGFS